MLLLLALLADAVQHGEPLLHRQADLLVQQAVDGGGVGHPGLGQDARLVVALLAVADDGGGAAHGAGSRGGAVGGEGAEVAAHRGVHPVDALAAHLDEAALTSGAHGSQDVGLGEILDELHLAGVVVLQALLGVGDDVAAPVLQRGDAVDAAVLHGDVKPLRGSDTDAS